MTSRWPHVRAALITVHLVAIVLMALPAPSGGMNRSAWKDPTVQAEFDAWAGRLQGLGIDTDNARLEDWAWDVASGWMKARSALLRPFSPYYRWAGTQQSWRMFVAPHRYPSRLRVEVERQNAWETVYEARDPDANWREWQLGHDRMRAALFRYAWPHYRRPYAHFTDWLALRAAQDFPQATRIRVSWGKARTPSPTEARSGELPPVKRHGSRTLELRR